MNQVILLMRRFESDCPIFIVSIFYTSFSDSMYLYKKFSIKAPLVTGVTSYFSYFSKRHSHCTEMEK